MVGFDVGNSESVEFEEPERSECLVRLEDQEIGITKMGTSVQIGDLSTHDEGGVPAAGTQSGHGHGSARRLAVCPGEPDGGICGGDTAEQCRSSGRRHSCVTCRFEFWVVIGDC